MVAFKNDELGAEINPKLTFAGTMTAISVGDPNFFYEVLGGADDSIVRERIFEKLAELKKVDYDVIYDIWLSAV
jgi:hypothetical protein